MTGKTATHPVKSITKTAKDQNFLVSRDDLYHDYDITQSPAMGSEVEQIVTTNNAALIDVDMHHALKARLDSAGIAVSDEPLASIFEIKTAPHKNAAAMMAEMRKLSADFSACIHHAGYRTAQTGYLGHITLQDAMRHRIPSERADGLLEHFIRNGQEICARQPLMTTSVHLSLSYADPRHLYDVAKLFMVLTPVLAALCENTGGMFDGQRVTFNPSTTIRLSQADGRGGLSPAIIAATDPDDLIRRQAHHIFTTRMMMHLDEAGTMRITDRHGQHPSLEELQTRDLNTHSNALLSESMQYHMLKITSLRDTFGRMAGKRLEIRMADNGAFQHDLLAILGEAIGLDPAFRAALISALTESGLNPFSPETGLAANAALNSIAQDRKAAMSVPLGNSTVGQVAKTLLMMLESSFGPDDSLHQARNILHHGPQTSPVIRV